MQQRAFGTEGVLARMPGLPTKQEAETQGGKAGFHLGRGKTSYGRILEVLSLFRATTDKSVAAQLLLQIQGAHRRVARQRQPQHDQRRRPA